MTAIAAVVMAAIAGVLVLQYVSGADDRAQGDLELVDVLVASKDIPRGTSGERVLADYVAHKKFTRASRPPSSLAPEAASGIDSLYAAATIPAGQPLSRALFVEQSEAQGTALAVAEGKQAITINVDETHGVAGFVAPNDTVNVILTLDAKNIEDTNKAPAKLTAFLIPGAKVLAVGQTTALGPQDTVRQDTNNDGKIDDTDESSENTDQKQGLITIEVTPRQAEQIAHAVASGTIYLSVNPAGFDASTFQTPEEIVEIVNLFDQDLKKLREVQGAMASAPASEG
jgi:pilus assembly protein CpaB